MAKRGIKLYVVFFLVGCIITAANFVVYMNIAVIAGPKKKPPPPPGGGGIGSGGGVHDRRTLVELLAKGGGLVGGTSPPKMTLAAASSSSSHGTDRIEEDKDVVGRGGGGGGTVHSANNDDGNGGEASTSASSAEGGGRPTHHRQHHHHHEDQQQPEEQKKHRHHHHQHHDDNEEKEVGGADEGKDIDSATPAPHHHHHHHNAHHRKQLRPSHQKGDDDGGTPQQQQQHNSHDAAASKRKKSQPQKKKKQQGSHQHLQQLNSDNNSGSSIAASSIGDTGSDNQDHRHHHHHHHGRHHQDKKKDNSQQQKVGATDQQQQHLKSSRGRKKRYVAFDDTVAVNLANNNVSTTSSGRKYANITFDEGIALYKQYLNEKLPVEIEQSSRKFSDILERDNAGVRLDGSSLTAKGEDNRADDDDSQHVQEQCDPRDADYTPEKDQACVAYMQRLSNWDSIKPMSSQLSTGRTIKFKVYFKHLNASAVIKVSQKKFALEPASEVVAYHADRVLGFQRVPPTVWLPIPVEFLMVASASMSPFYTQWFDAFALKYDTTKPLLTKNCYAGRSAQCVNVSVQLWLADVHEADDTELKPSINYKAYLSLPLPEGAEGQRIMTKMQQDPMKKLSLAELMDEFIFDCVIGNTDRWFGHNSFALGACTSPQCQNVAVRSSVTTKSSPRLAFIDQGSSFYRQGIPDESPFKRAGNDTLCRFRKRTAERLVALADNDYLDLSAKLRKEQGGAGAAAAVPPITKPSGIKFFKELKSRLPGGIFNLANAALVRSAGKRLDTLAAHVQRCLERYPERDVLYF